MPKYKPQLISFDQERYDYDMKLKEKGDAIFNKAVSWVEEYFEIPPEDLERFSWEFTQYFWVEYYERNKHNFKFNIAPNKLLDLAGIDLKPLKNLEVKFNRINGRLQFQVVEEGSNGFVLNDSDYKTFTKSAEENKKLRDGNAFIEAIEKLQPHTTVYPYQIHNATNGFISYDMRTNKYKVSVN